MAKISTKNIAEAIYKTTKDKTGTELEHILKRCVQILQEKRLLGKSEEVLQTLQNIVDKYSGTIRAKITTAKVIGVTERKKIEHEIKDKYKAEHVISEFFEKAELLGGMRVEVGDEVVDNTYKSNLGKLEKFLVQDK